MLVGFRRCCAWLWVMPSRFFSRFYSVFERFVLLAFVCCSSFACGFFVGFRRRLVGLGLCV